jgi:hypothetical protein
VSGVAPLPGPPPGETGRSIPRWSAVLAALVVVELGLGVAVLVEVAPGRPSGWWPDTHRALYAVHSVVGLALAVGALLFASQTSRSTRLLRLGGRTGAVGVGIAGVGGLLTAAHPWRLTGLALMLVGPLVAIFGYAMPALDRLTDGDTPAGRP